MKDAFVGFIKEDWQSLSPFYHLTFYTGAIFIFAAWLGDHWSDQQTYHPVFFTQNNEHIFQAGWVIIAISLIILVVENANLYRKIFRLRRKYPIQNKGRDFRLLNFNGWLYLFDLKTHTYFHVKNQITAWDLGFTREWETFHHELSAESLLQNTGMILDEYRLDPYGIRTRGATGT